MEAKEECMHGGGEEGRTGEECLDCSCCKVDKEVESSYR